MKDWRPAAVSPGDSMADAIAKIDRTGLQIALVVGQDGILLGILTDGDIRRALLKGSDLKLPVTQVMNPNPASLRVGAKPGEVFDLMRRRGIHQLPILDESGKIAGIEHLDSFILPQTQPNWVVLMAGGLGTRLRPLTNDTPKPLLKVGGKPILHKIIENFAQSGFSNFYISLNYLGHMIRDYFGDGEKFGVRIEYVVEEMRLGTAGALGLIKERLEHPFFVMNGDLLTNLNMASMLDFHVEHGSVATMAVREYEFQVPFGVVHSDSHRLIAVEEKPVQQFFVNAGMYVLDPEVISEVPKDQFFDMPSLINKLIDADRHCSSFPIREMWMDIGRVEDFERANKIFG